MAPIPNAREVLPQGGSGSLLTLAGSGSSSEAARSRLP
jgi:hypothetical protein